MPRGWNDLKINTKTLTVILSKIYSSSSLNYIIKNNNTKISSLMSLIPHYQVKQKRKRKKELTYKCYNCPDLVFGSSNLGLPERNFEYSHF